MKTQGWASRFLASLAPLAFVLAGSGCADSKSTGDVDTSRASEFGFQTSVRTSLVEEGKRVYLTYCIGCHGEKGDGNGEAARFLSPRPRDFVRANFKFSSTRAGLLPADVDLKRTITDGLKGSSMPGWDLLPARSVDALIAYIKSLSPRWEEQDSASPIPLVNDPYRAIADKTEAIERGKTIYHGFATCWTCHPSYVPEEEINSHLAKMENPTRDVFRDKLFESEGKPNKEGEMIFPPDFHRDFLRSGVQVDDLYRSIAAGITGTAMPTWVDSMTYKSEKTGELLVEPADVWAISYYVHSLMQSRPAKIAEADVSVRERPHRIYQVGEPFEPITIDDDTTTDVDFEED